ncbi:MAG: helix-turn-helix domain-containing protein [Ruminococcaceae bacterium]|nr:helix-turn-helix domain-containing protein [Oscillospiraceae bacterium]
MNKPDVKELLNRLYRVTGFRISIHDRNGRELAASPESPHAFCRCLQQDAFSRRRCEESDREAFRRAAETGTLTVYRCPFGLYEAVCPLYRYGSPAGFLMMGQVPEAGVGVEEALRRAEGHGDPDVLKKALTELPGYTRERIEACAEIMAVFADYITLTDAVQSPSGDTPSDVRAYLTDHYAEPITIASLCARFAISRTALLNRYRDRYGEPLGQTLIRIRMTEAQKLLSHTALPISEVAAHCGYTDPGYFAKAFRKHFGVAPTSARQST